MKKKLWNLIAVLLIGGTIILPQYCPHHHKFDDCWTVNSSYGTNNGHK